MTQHERVLALLELAKELLDLAKRPRYVARRVVSPSWWRHVWDHADGCEYVAWWCSDGWYCGGCGESWDERGRRVVRD